MIADRYEVLKTLGQGTFGRTLLARDTVSDQTVALKVLDGRGADWKAHDLFGPDPDPVHRRAQL